MLTNNWMKGKAQKFNLFKNSKEIARVTDPTRIKSITDEELISVSGVNENPEHRINQICEGDSARDSAFLNKHKRSY